MTYQVTVRGSIWKPVICEYCKCEFCYRIKGEATGVNYSPFYWKQSGAIKEATDNANKELQEILENATEKVRCPDCGKYQKSMEKSLKRWRWVEVGLSLFPLFIVFMCLSTEIPGLLTEDGNPVPWFLILYAIFSLITIGFLIRRALTYDPNADAPRYLNQPFSEKYQVLRRAEYETLIMQDYRSDNY